MMNTALQLADQVPVRRVCAVLAVARSSFYRARNPQPAGPVPFQRGR